MKWTQVAVGVVAVVGIVFTSYVLFGPSLNSMMFKPHARDLPWAQGQLKELMSSEVSTLKVPAVNRDVNLVYATARISDATRGRIAKRGRLMSDLPVVTYEILLADCLAFISWPGRDSGVTTDVKIALGDANDAHHRDFTKSRFREWLSGSPLPYRDQ